MSPVKEPHFFVEPGDGLPNIEDRIGSREEYEALFGSSLHLRGEASTSYSHFPARRGVPERIHKLLPDARFIYVVRDPIDRLVSHYLHQVAFGGERRPIEAAVGNLEEPTNIYICAGKYATQLDRYRRVFDEDRILVIDHVALRDETRQTLRTIFGFLGASPSFTCDLYSQKFNMTEERRAYPRLYARLRDRAPLRRLPPWMRNYLRGIGQSGERFAWRRLEKPSVPQPLVEKLRVIYVEEVARLREVTGQAFASWSM